MPVVVSDLLAELLDGSQITMDADDIKEDVDGAGKVFVCKGDLPQGSSIRGARAVVIDGNLIGHPNTLAEIFSQETVVVLGSVQRAHIKAQKLVVLKSVTDSIIRANKTVDVVEDLGNSQISMGASRDELDALTERFATLRSLLPQHEVLSQEVEAARRSLSRLLQVTGVVFNLNIGKIVQQDEGGLKINLTTFYEAVAGRSLDEVDKALRQFFAKAVLGLLTRLNKDYIASGRGHQERFKKVVLKLQDLVLKCREYDKFVEQNHSETAQVEALCEKFKIELPSLAVKGALLPSLETIIRGVEDKSEDSLQLREYRFELEQGKRSDTDEVRTYRGDRLTEMVVVNKKGMRDFIVRVNGKEIKWELNAVV